MSVGEFNLLVGNVHEMYLNEDTIFALGPPGDWMSKYQISYDMCWS